MNNDEEILTEEYIHKIYKVLAEAMLAALEKGTMFVEESRYSSQYILDKMDTIKTKSELVIFLEDLSNRWHAYYDAFVTIRDEVWDTKKIQDVEEQLDEMNNNTQ